MLGETGVGKSAVCNVFIGDLPKSKVFPVSAKSDGRTMETKILNAFFRGDPGRPFRIIDTQGFNEPGSPDNPNSSFNLQIMNDIMKKLTEVDQVGVFLICLPGISNRITNSLLYMLKYFQDIFGHKMINEEECDQDPSVFWDNCVIAFTKVKMSKTSCEDRFEAHDMKDEDLAEIYTKDLAKRFKSEQTQLPFFFIDSFFKEGIEEEKKVFSDQTEKLYKMLTTNAPAVTKAMLLAYSRMSKGNIPEYVSDM